MCIPRSCSCCYFPLESPFRWIDTFDLCGVVAVRVGGEAISFVFCSLSACFPFFILFLLLFVLILTNILKGGELRALIVCCIFIVYFVCYCRIWSWFQFWDCRICYTLGTVPSQDGGEANTARGSHKPRSCSSVETLFTGHQMKKRKKEGEKKTRWGVIVANSDWSSQTNASI